MRTTSRIPGAVSDNGAAPALRGGATIALALVVATSAASAARAQTTDSSPALSWLREDGAESCISVQELAARVEKRLGKAVFVSASGASLHVEGRIAPRGSAAAPPRSAGAAPPNVGWSVRLTTSDAQGRVLGHRALDGAGKDCRALDEALVLVIALAVDSSGGFVALPEGLTDAGDPGAALLADLRQAPPAGTTAQTAPEPHAAPEQPAPAVAPKRDDDDARWHFRFGVSAQFTAGLVPGIGFGVGLEPQLIVPGDWLVGLRGSFVLPSSLTIDGGGSLNVGALLGAAFACTPAAPPGWAALRGCLGAQVGRLEVDASGLTDPQHPRQLLFEPWLGGEASWPLGTAVRLRLHASATVPAIRDDIRVFDSQRRPRHVYRVAPVTFSLGGGITIAIGS